MNEAQHQFVEDLGQNMVSWGLSRTTGRVYAYLLLCLEPASLDQMAAELGMAKSGAKRRRPPAGRAGHGPRHRPARQQALLYEALYDTEAILAARTPRPVTSWTGSPGRGGWHRPARRASTSSRWLGAAGPVQRAPRTGAADPRKETSMTSAISTGRLSKDYGSGRGLFDLDLEVQAARSSATWGPTARQDHHHQAADGDDPSQRRLRQRAGDGRPARRRGDQAADRLPSPASCPSSAGCAAARSSPTSAGCAEASTPAG